MPNRTSFKTHQDYLDWYRDYRKKNRKKFREYYREYNRCWRLENGYHNEKNWDKKNPEAVKAHRALKYAIKKGKIKKSKICEVCKKEYEPRKILGHHDDYSKPLEVIWVCGLCHKKIHQGKLKIERWIKNGKTIFQVGDN